MLVYCRLSELCWNQHYQFKIIALGGSDLKKKKILICFQNLLWSWILKESPMRPIESTKLQLWNQDVCDVQPVSKTSQRHNNPESLCSWYTVDIKWGPIGTENSLFTCHSVRNTFNKTLFKIVEVFFKIHIKGTWLVITSNAALSYQMLRIFHLFLFSKIICKIPKIMI